MISSRFAKLRNASETLKIGSLYAGEELNMFVVKYDEKCNSNSVWIKLF
jgi:hypothetical protein